jgi:hypothetical protein
VNAGTPGFSITITAYDAYGNVANNYAGPAVMSDSSGSLSPTTPTFTAGIYTGTVTIATVTTADVITVKDSSTPITATSNSFNVVAGTLDHFVFNTIGQQTAGTAFSITITAKDSSGNTVTSYAGSASFTDLSDSISLKSTGMFTNGVLTATVVITKAFPSDTITATDTSKGSTGTSNTFDVVSASATQLVYTVGAAQSITTGTVSSMITVQLQDSNGNPVNAGTGGITVSLTATGTTTGTFWSDSGGTTKITSITIASGANSASFYYSDTTAGSPVLTASSAGLTSAVTTFTINSYKLVFVTGATQSLAPGQLSSAIVVERETPTGGGYFLAAGITVQLTTSSSGGKFEDSSGTVITSITIPILGDTTASFYYVDTSTGTSTLTASSGGYASGTTQFTIYAAAFSGFKVTASGGGNIGTQATGTPFSITVTAIDQKGNTFSGSIGTVTLSASSGTGTISPTTTGTFTNGVWTGPVTLTAAGSISITATSSLGPTGQSNTFTVYTPAVTSFSFSTISGSKTAGTTFSVTITAKDQTGITMTSFTGSATLTETGVGAGGTVSPSSVSFTNGVYTGNVYVTKAGAGVTITATSGTATGVSNTFTVNMGAPVGTITVAPPTASVTAGNTETYTATGTDAYGNTGTLTGVTWSISSGAGGSWNQGTSTYTSHTASAAGTPWTVTATDGTATGTASLTVTAGAVSQYVFGTIGTQNSGVGFTVTITAEDQYGNTVTSDQGTQTLSGHSLGGGSITPTSITFTNGVWTNTVTITTSSQRNGVYLSVGGSNSNTFTVDHS